MNLTQFHPDRNSTVKFAPLELPGLFLGISLGVGLGLHHQGFLPLILPGNPSGIS